jgi:glycosyl-4,4'-diaponeurosporenoate acyltransferase
MEKPPIPYPVSGPVASLLCAAGWLLWSLLVGYVGHRLPTRNLERDSWLTRPRPWGESPASYERRLRIRQWKHWLPDAGATFAGGVRKASLVGRDPFTRRRLVQETRRAELVHLGLWPFWLVTALWLPPSGVLLNLLFATAFNLPCLWVQRFNRLRLQGLATTRDSASGC